jgi:hypothetical protein
MVREGFTMKKNSNNTERNTAQIIRFRSFLQNNIVSCSMASKELGIHQKCLTRYKRMLEKSNQLWQVKKAQCKITGHIVWFLTCNPKFKPNDNQLKLF